MVLQVSTFNSLKVRNNTSELSEYGAITIHCSEVEEKKGYLQLRVLDVGTELSAKNQSPYTYRVPLFHKTEIHTITDCGYEICAIYKQEGKGEKKLEVIFLYARDKEKANSLLAIPFLDPSEFYFSRPGITVSIALKYCNP